MDFNIIKNLIPRTFEEYIQKLPEYEKISIENFTILNPELLCEFVINENKIIICTDGSYKSTSSGGATVITDKEEKIMATGHNPDTGQEWFQCSFCSESQACLSAYIFLTQYCKYLNVSVPPSIYFSDNKGLITKISHGLKITKHTTSQDLIRNF